MLSFHKKYAADIFSQNGEDGIIAEICQRLKIGCGECCEFGAHDGLFCSNTRALMAMEWHGTLIEADKNLSRELVKNCLPLNQVKVISETFVTPKNVNELVPQKLDLLSIDVDGIDYDIWKAYTGDAKIVIIEINSSIHPTAELPISHPEKGTAYRPMIHLGNAKGYSLLVHCGNLIFVKDEYIELFPEVKANPVIEWQLYFNQSWL